MSICWKKGNNEPVSHLENLLHEIIEDNQKYYISVKEQRINGKIKSIYMVANIVEEGE